MVYSSSAILGITRYQDPNHFLFKQLVRAGLGVVALLRVRRRACAGSSAWAPGSRGRRGPAARAGGGLIGQVSNGASVAPLGFFSIQPTDLARFAAVVFLAWWLKRRTPAELASRAASCRRSASSACWRG